MGSSYDGGGSLQPLLFIMAMFILYRRSGLQTPAGGNDKERYNEREKGRKGRRYEKKSIVVILLGLKKIKKSFPSA